MPPGQYVAQGFPVLSAGPTPHTPLHGMDVLDPAGRRRRSKSWTWDEFQALPAEDVTRRHPLRDALVQARHRPGGACPWTRCSARSSTTRRVRDGVLRRRLHHEPAGRGRHGRPGLGGVRLRRPAARGRARRPGPPAGAAPVLLEEREVGAGPGAARSTTSRASGRTTATTSTETHDGNIGTRTGDLAGRHGQPGSPTIPPSVRTIELPGCRAGRATGPGEHLDVRLTSDDGYEAERSYSIASAPVRAVGDHRRAPRRRRGVAVPDRGAAARRRDGGPRPDRRLLRLGRRRRRHAAAAGRLLFGSSRCGRSCAIASGRRP